jgi:hypothetical protein
MFNGLVDPVGILESNVNVPKVKAVPAVDHVVPVILDAAMFTLVAAGTAAVIVKTVCAHNEPDCASRIAAAIITLALVFMHLSFFFV